MPTTMTRLGTTLHRLLAASGAVLGAGLLVVLLGDGAAKTAGLLAILASAPAVAITNHISGIVDALLSRAAERRTPAALPAAYQTPKYTRPHAA